MKLKYRLRIFITLGAMGIGTGTFMTPSAAFAAVANVGVSGFSFTPPSVTINVNDQVQWTWSGFHSTTSDTGLWDSTVQGPAFTFTQTFSSAGSFPYHCIPHASLGMTGTVIVQAGGGNVAPTVSISSPSDGAIFTAPWSGTIQATAGDTDGSVVKVDFFAGANLLGTIDNPPANINFPVPNLAAGSYVLTAVATDNGGATTTSAGISITVNAVNTPPVLTVPADQTINELGPLRVNASAIDTDIPANVLTFSLISPPVGMDIQPSTGLITWTPTEAQGPSTNMIEVQVSDNGTPSMSATKSFVVVVQELNSPPTLTVPADQAVNELATLTVTITATDPDLPANPLDFALISAPTGMTIDAASGVIRWTPAESQSPSTNFVQVSVSDSNLAAADAKALSVTNGFTVVVVEVNKAPLLPTIADQTARELTLLIVTNTAMETNIHATLEYALLNPPAGANIDTNGIITWTPTLDQGPSTNVITTVVTSTDLLDLVNPHLRTTNSFTVIVNPIAPVQPILGITSISSSNLTLSWTANPGRIYRVEHNPDLNPTNWIDLDGDITATSNSASASDILTTTNRFYRIRALP